jgi:hypothetical protein
MERPNNLSHDRIDAFVTTVLGWFARTPEITEDVAFSDEWERKQIARELHWN